MVLDEGARINCVAAQVADVESKIDLAMTESVRLLRTAGWTSMADAPVVFASTIATPTISRVLCNNVLRCFGFPNVKSEDVDDIMSKVVWWNLAKFMAHNLSQTLAVWGGVAALTLTTGVGGIALAVAAPLLEVIPAARMIIKCACDLIIILDRAFSAGGKTVTIEHIRQASKEYTTRFVDATGESSTSRRKKVHKAIEELIPLITLKFYKGLQIATVQAGMREIIKGNRFAPGDSQSLVSVMASQPKLSLDSLSFGEAEELAAWEQIVSSDVQTN